MKIEVMASKDANSAHPIPTAWRSTIKEIVTAFSNNDYQLTAGIPGVMPVSNETAEHIRSYVNDYGVDLIQLPDESWNSSTHIWHGSHWDVLIDLWSAQEGQSDLVLSLKVTEVESRDAQFNIYMVYVP